jgi:hypothetical protein
LHLQQAQPRRLLEAQQPVGPKAALTGSPVQAPSGREPFEIKALRRFLGWPRDVAR